MPSFKQFTDNELICHFQNGHIDALETLVLRHKEKIYTSIYLLVKDKYLAEDLFQEVFIKIIDTLTNKKYNEEGKFLPWAIRIARNLCVDHFRKIKRRPTIKNTDNYDIFEVLNFSEESAEDKKIRLQSYGKMHKMLESLPEEQREVLILRHFADLSFKEIAELMNCSINTALGRMRYGLINLRKLMTEKQIAL
jgi:RNA polymerase sigma-70 factor (ECF subfamily)